MNTMNMPYGAAELRTSYNRNLAFALGIAVTVHLAAIGLYLLLGAQRPMILTPPIIPVITPPMIGGLAPQEKVVDDMGGGGPAGGGKTLGTIGTPDVVSAVILPSLDDTLEMPFATLGRMGTALPVLGSGRGNGDTSLTPSLHIPLVDDGRGKARSAPDTDLDPDAFTEVQEYPKFDNWELAANLQYPDAARRASIQGTVVVRVLIDRNGKAVRTIIDASDHVMLEGAAVDAVLATTFTPARQNNLPTAVWMQVPVVFQLW